MATFTVVLDANVLYSYTVRDAVMWLSLTDLFRIRWSEHIHQEWIGALVRKGHDRAILARIRAQMEYHNADALVTHYEPLIESISLPDPDDRHVVAAAIRANADAIVTFNTRDFPREILADYDIEVLHPDDFIHYQIELSPEKACRAFSKMRTTKSRPPIGVDDLLASLQRSELPQTVRLGSPQETDQIVRLAERSSTFSKTYG